MGIKNNGYRGATGDVGGRSGKIRQHETREDAILAWHFVSDDRRLGYDATSLEVEPGYIYYTDSPIVLCSSGLHASVDPFDALHYAQGGYLCRVAVWGDVTIGGDKIAGRNREVLAAHDITRELRLLGCWCARQVWHLLTDERSRNAVEVAERFADGQSTKEELDAARDAARDAAWAAASAAAWDAAGGAARTAARDSAWDAAWDAAWAAASSAASAAARDSARTAQRAEFNRMITERFKEAY